MSSTVSQELQRFLLTQTPEQINALAVFIQTIQNNRAQSPEFQFLKSPMRKRYKNSAVKRAKATKAGFQPTELIRAAKRPLNSWMAFRSYYSVIFTSFQQKDISGFLTRMWSEDLFRAKWTMVAKAYSVIRDQVGKDKAPLDIFLRIVCPLIGIIAPAEYLDMLGWAMPSDHQREMNRIMIPNPSDFSAELRTTNLSPDDIVNHCREIGYHSNEQTGMSHNTCNTVTSR
jgi:hypothetical protein